MSQFAKFKAHACLMIVAWILIASTGILIARYYKYLVKSRNICGTKLWFAIHSSIMPWVPIISITSLLIILSALDWTWVETTSKTEFIHSIFGIIAISFSFVQAFMGLVRCNPESRFRPIFYVFHSAMGVTALIFAITALFTGANIADMNLGKNGWGMLIGWSAWLGILILILEFIQCLVPRNPNDYSGYNSPDNEPASIRNIKSILLFLHWMITLAFTTALITVIGSRSPPETTDAISR